MKNLHATFLMTTLAVLLCATRTSANLAISPNAIDNAYTGPLDLTITGLDSVGQTVVIEEFIDADNSSTITAGDILVRKILVTDGQVTSIAGQRNLNIPGDEDSAVDSQIHTRLLIAPNNVVDRVDGRYIFRVSPNGAGFAPFTGTLIVSQKDYAGSGISGATGQAGAIVLFATSAGDKNTVGVTRADGSGNYSMKLAPGSYQPIASKSGFVFNGATGPVVTVNSGTISNNQNLTLVASTRTISGTIRNTPSPVGLPGLAVEGQSQTGFISVTFTDANGHYILDANAGQWKLNAGEQGTAQYGVVSFKQSTDTSTGNVTAFNFDFPSVTSLIFGSVKTPANVAIPFIRVGGNTNGSPAYKTSGVTDANGNYALGVTIGSWNEDSFDAPGYVMEERLGVVVNTDGSTVLQNLVGHAITAHLRGQIRDNHNNVVGSVRIFAYESDPAGNNIQSNGTADASGNFDIGVFGGGGGATKPWALSLLFDSNTLPSYVSSSPEFQVQDGVDINGINYLVYIVTAHLRGQVLDENSSPIGNIAIFASLDPNGFANQNGNVDSGGNFDLPIFGGSWSLGLSNIFGLGLIPEDFPPISVTDNVDQNNLVFRARHATAAINGSVKSNTNVAIAGVTVFATTTLNGVSYSNNASTDASGNYSLPVFSSTWSVSVDSSQLGSQGYQSVSSQNALVNPNNVTINFVASPQTLQLTAAVSRKTHGTSGSFDVNLPLTGTRGVECRSGGANGDHMLIFTFDNPLTNVGAVTASATAPGGGTQSVTVSSSLISSGDAHQYVVNLTGVPNAQYTTISLNNVQDSVGHTINVVSPSVGVLAGDTTADGFVNSGDIAQTKSKSGQSVGSANFRADLTFDGFLNSGDIASAKSKSGTALPTPP